VLVGMLRDYLVRDGFDATAADGDAGARGVDRALRAGGLDVMMPGTWHRGAAAICPEPGPVLMLTACATTLTIVGLELGADDYVPKPCTPRELVARIRAILRRAQPQDESGGPITVGALSIWPQQRRAEWAGRAVELTSTEFNLLEVLARNAGQPVGKGALSEQALGRPLARYDRSVDVHMSSIRRKLVGDDGARHPDGSPAGLPADPRLTMGRLF
jgi:DNA-binding response OmpR family regulator